MILSAPTVFLAAGVAVDQAGHDDDDPIHRKVKEGKSGEALFFELALEDLRQAADLFRPIHDQTDEGAMLFVKSWSELMDCVASKNEALKKAG